MRWMLVMGWLGGAGLLMGQAGGAGTQRKVADVSGVVKGVLAKHPSMPGMWGAVVEKEGVVALGAAGVRKMGSPEAVTGGDQVHLGSDTKAMTAVLVGQLIEEQKLSAGATMADLFPALKGKMDAAMAGVTVAQLMAHTAGLPHDMEWRLHEPGGAGLPAQRAALVADALAKPPLTPPGKTYAYSNVGYVILGAVVEAKRGQPWELVLRKRVLEPLGMDSAGFGPPGKGTEVDQPWGHVVIAGRAVALRNDNPSQMGPAGRVHCSMEDWGKFVALFLKGEEATILGAREREALLTPAEGQSYMGGWMAMDRGWGGGRVYTHSGSNTMWYCTVWMAPRKGFAVLAGVNCGGEEAGKACDEICSALISARK